MKDLIVLAMTVAFFAMAVGYVALCNRIIGPDEADLTDTGDGGDDTASGGKDADIGGDAGDRSTVEVDA